MLDKKNKSDKKTRLSIFRVAGMTLLILLVLFAVGFLLKDYFTKTPAELENASATDGTTIVNVSSDNVIDFQSYDKNSFILLTDTAVKYYDAYGNSYGSNTCTYISPVLKVKGTDVLIYDRGGTSLKIERNGVEYKTETFESIITSAAIGKANNYAYVLNADGGFQSNLYVYTFRGKMKFNVGLDSEYVTDIALSDNGKYVCAAAVSVENAAYYTCLNLYKFNNDEAVFEIVLKGVSAYKVSFVNNKTIAAYTDGGVYLIDRNGEYTILQSYSSTEMKSSDCNSSVGCTLINKYGNEKNAHLSLFTDNYKLISDFDFNTAVYNLACSKDYFIAVFENSLKVYDSRGQYLGVVQIDEGAKKAVTIGRKIFLQYAEGIKCYSVTSADLYE